MAYIDIDIEDHLDEVDTIYLINELKRRKVSQEEAKEINKRKIDDDKEEAMRLLKVNSLREVVKFEAFIKVFRDVPEAELDNFLSKY